MKILGLMIAALLMTSCAQKEKIAVSKAKRAPVSSTKVSVKSKVERKPAQQVTDADSIEFLGSHVKLELLQNLNVNPRTQFYKILAQGAYNDVKFEMASIDDFGREIASGTVYTIVDIRFSKAHTGPNSYYDFITIDLADNDDIREIVFKTPVYVGAYDPGVFRPLTVGELKLSLQKYFKLLPPGVARK
jgi:hypothetical protein